MNYPNDYILEAKQLRSKGAQLGQLHQLYKVLGAGTTALSGIALISTGAAAIPLAVGLVSYGGSVLSEWKRTGKLRPLPWVEEDMSAIAARSLSAEVPEALATSPHHYLDSEDKALYYLTNFQGQKLTALAEQIEDDEAFEHIVMNLVDHLVVAHQDALNHPELLSRSLGEGAFIRDALDALPPEMKEKVSVEPQRWGAKVPGEAVGAQTQLNAIEAEATPVMTPNPFGEGFDRRREAGSGMYPREVYASPEEEATQFQSNSVNASQAQSAEVDIFTALADRDECGHAVSWLVTGLPGSGKGTVAACNLAKLLKLEPTIELFGIDPKSDPDEADRWQCFKTNNLYAFDITQSLALNVDRVMDGILAVLQGFQAHKGPKLLLLDELLGMMDYLRSEGQITFTKKLAGLIGSIATQGRSRDARVWCLTQGVGVGSNGLTTDIANVMAPLYLAKKSDVYRITSHPSFNHSTKIPPADRIYLAPSLKNDGWVEIPTPPTFTLPVAPKSNFNQKEESFQEVVKNPINTNPSQHSNVASYDSERWQSKPIDIPAPKQPDTFDRALASLDKEGAELADAFMVELDALKRVVSYLAQSRRGQVTTAQQVREVKGNRKAGVDSIETANQIMEVMELLGVCEPAKSSEGYLVVAD